MHPFLCLVSLFFLSLVLAWYPHSRGAYNKHKVFEDAGLIGLFNGMGKQVEENIAKEAIENYDAEKNQTSIRGVTLKANKQTLSRDLNLTSIN